MECFCDGNGFVDCWECGLGEGQVLTCWDDLCQGAGECMHGDGYDDCTTCNGSGVVNCPAHDGEE